MDSKAQLTVDIIAKVVEQLAMQLNYSVSLDVPLNVTLNVIKKSVFNLLFMVIVVSHHQIKHQRQLKNCSRLNQRKIF